MEPETWFWAFAPIRTTYMDLSFLTLRVGTTRWRWSQVMPQGLIKSPATFKHMIEQVIAGVKSHRGKPSLVTKYRHLTPNPLVCGSLGIPGSLHSFRHVSPPLLSPPHHSHLGRSFPLCCSFLFHHCTPYSTVTYQMLLVQPVPITMNCSLDNCLADNTCS